MTALLKPLIPVLTAILGLFSLPALAAETTGAAPEVNVYSYRQPFLMQPIIEDFQKETGIQVNIIFAKSGLIERLTQEGQYSPADVVLTTDISRLLALADKNLSQKVNSTVLEQAIPASYRDPNNQWFALTMRVRNIYSTRRNDQPENISYQDLADPKYRGKICTRSGKHPYNVSLVAAMIARQGEAQTRTWLQGVKANLARRPQGNDRAQVKAVKEGVCDLALGNSYYYGKMLQDETQKPWAESVYINFPDQQGYGAHVNVSGMVMSRYAPNRDNAVKLMEYLASARAQSLYAEVNMEYPVNPNVAPSPLVASWGQFRADTLPMSEIARNQSAALKLLDEVRFDL